MPFDPFAGLATADPFAGTGGSDPFAGISPPEPEPDRGFLGTIVHETGEDIKGAARTAGAVALSPLALVGANVPIKLSDLSSRDLKGAAMMAAMAVGGFAARGVRALPAVGKLAAKGVLGRAGATAAAEFASGAAFGLMTPEEGESRLEAAAKSAALFGTLGAGASLMKSAIKATVGGALAGMKDQAARAGIARTAQDIDVATTLQEYAGLTLRNPDTGLKVGVRRQSSGQVLATYYRTGPGAASHTLRFQTMSDALASTTAGGYLEDLGAYRVKFGQGVVKALNPDAVALVDDPTGRTITERFGLLRKAEYAGVRQAAADFKSSNDLLTSLAAEIPAPRTEYGAIAYGAKWAEGFAVNIGLKPADAAKMPVGELVFEGVKRGLVNPDAMFAGLKVEDALRELRLNGLKPIGADILVSGVKDGFFLRVLTPRTLGKLHPSFEQLFNLGDTAAANTERWLEPARDFLFQLQQRVPEAKAKLGVQIIDEAGNAARAELKALPAETAAKIDLVFIAQRAAMQTAHETGDPHIIDFVRSTQEYLNRYRTRLVEKGMLEKGYAGYFPIVNVGQWKLVLDKALEDGAVRSGVFHGFYETEAEAREVLATLKETGQAQSGSILRNRFWWDGDALVGMNPKQFGKLQQAVRQAGATADEAKEIASGVARIIPGRKSAGSLQERVLGIRDFSEDPFEALSIYTGTVERAIQYNTFARDAEKIVETIPAVQPNWRRAAEQYVIDQLGRPRPIEVSFQALMENLSERLGGRLPVPERALATYSAALRSYESLFRLGGFFSGIINLSQIALGTFPVLGARWTAKGLTALTSPDHWRQAVTTLKEAGFDAKGYVPLAEAGSAMPLHSTVRAAWRTAQLYGISDPRKWEAYKDTLFRIGLFVFNGTERINRVVTAWGAFNKALSEGADKVAAGLTASQAAEAAGKAVERTQFNYRRSNTPEFLRGPVGAVLFQFKNFFINEMEFIASLSPKEFARFGATLWALGGTAVLFNMPGADVLDAASGFFFDKKMSEAEALAPESWVGRSVVFGMPGLFTGIDLSDYIGIGGLADLTRSIVGPAPKDVLALGTYLRDAAIDYKSTGAVSDATKNRALFQLLPSVIRRFNVGRDIVSTGEVSNPYSGKLVYKPDDRIREAILAGIGTPTVRLTQERAADAVVTRVKDRWIKARTGYARAAADAILSGDNAQAQSILAEANATGHPLTQETVRYWVRELQRPGTERRLNRLPKQLRQQYEELYDATGAFDF